MQWTEAVGLALQSLWANKMRTVLTLIGMIIGVASVIMVITLVNGANHYVSTKISGHGADVITVKKQPSVIFDAESYYRYQRRKDLTYDQWQQLGERCVSCQLLGAQLNTSGRVTYGRESSKSTEIRGWTPSMQTMTALNITEGRGMTEADEKQGAHIALVGYDVVQHLFKGADPIGKELNVDGSIYTVVGQGERQGTTLGQSQDDYVAIPLSAYLHAHGLHESLSYYIKAGSNSPAIMSQISDEVTAILRQIRHDRVGTEDDFSVESNGSLLGLWKSLTATFGAVLIGIASISLVVGGIVIMNIMLVSVTERTREIGIRKALGARRQDVLLQFLIESATMAAAGGIAGVLTGVGLSYVIANAVNWPATVSLWSVIAGLFVATSVGIFFGVYPASKAARLDPVIALRAEL